jgi:hypothetical protein
MLTMETIRLMKNQLIVFGSWSGVLKILKGNSTTKSKNLIPLSWAEYGLESRISGVS